MSRFVIALLAATFALSAFAAPPQPGEMDAYRQDGTLDKRIEYQRSFGNDRYDPALLEHARAKIRRASLEARGTSPELVNKIQPLPPSGRRGMPTTGTNRILTVLVEFNDIQHAPVNTRDYVDDALFGDGIPSRYPYESLTNYYQRASFDKLTIEGDTLGWYQTAYPRSNVVETGPGRENLIKEALQSYDAAGHDFSQYDNDNDGEIDYVIVIYAGPDTGWGSFWWAYQTGFGDQTFTLDGKTLGTYVFQFQDYVATNPFNPAVVIHETGHALGLPDMYDYDDAVGPRGGTGGLDIMDGNRGDHNGFHKWMLEWSTPTVVGVGAQRLTLDPNVDVGDGAVVMQGATDTNPFSEFFFVENRIDGGNDDASNWPGTGLMIWHVDSTLNAAGTNFAFDNSYTAHKLLRVMEADGLEEIEQNLNGDGGDFWQIGQVFDGTSTPNSDNYAGNPSAVKVTDIQFTASGISAVISVDELPPNVVTATINAAGNTLTIVYDESVVNVSPPTLNLSAGPVTASYQSGSDTIAINYALSRKVFNFETGTFSLPGGAVVDITGNPLAAVTDRDLLVGIDPDLTAPVAQSATVNANGNVLTLVFDDSVTHVAPPALAFSGGAVTATLKDGDGTNAISYWLSRFIYSDETGVYDLAPGSVLNEVLLPNEAVLAGDIVNESDVARPDPNVTSSEPRFLGLYANYYADNAFTMSSGFLNDPSGYTGDAYYAYVYAYYAVLYRYYSGENVRWGGSLGTTRDQAFQQYATMRYYQALLSYYAQLYSRNDYLVTYSNSSLYAYLYSYLAYEYAVQDLSQP